jgi:hypothetical protein
MAITISGDTPNFTGATLTTPTVTSPVFAGTPTGVGVLTNGTVVASTSGTSIDFTGIPSWVKRITVMFNGVSTNGTSLYQVQLGDSGGVETTGYFSSAQIAASAATSTTGLLANTLTVAADPSYGVMYISLFDAATNTWAASCTLGNIGTTRTSVSSGTKALSATLDRVRITTVNGTDAFDLGSINILFE